MLIVLVLSLAQAQTPADAQPVLETAPAKAPPTAPVVATEAAALTGEIFIQASISEASLALDDVELPQRAPTMLSAIPVGTHRVTAHTQCKRAADVVTVTAGAVARVNLNLEVGTGALDVRGHDGAIVVLDGMEKGTAPLTLGEVSCGSHTLTLSAPDHRTRRETFDVPAFQNTEINWTLDPIEAGSVAVVVQPFEAKVFLDGVEVSTGPTTLQEVEVGSHEIQAKLGGYVTQSKTVEVSKEQIARVEIALAPAPKANPKGVASNAMLAGGAISFTFAAYSYGHAREAYAYYQAIESDTDAANIWNTRVLPYSQRAQISAAVGVLLTGAGVALSPKLGWLASSDGHSFTLSHPL